MSQSATRASAREIRRAFGPSAVQHLDALEIRLSNAEKVIVQHSTHFEGIRALRSLDLDDMTVLFSQTGDHAKALSEVRKDFYDRSFAGRLRWLLTGR